MLSNCARRKIDAILKGYAGPPFAVRADYDKGEYHVYHIASGQSAAKYTYKTESQRALAAGRAAMQRETLNNEWRRKRALYDGSAKRDIAAVTIVKFKSKTLFGDKAEWERNCLEFRGF